MTSRTEFQDVNKVIASIGTECYGRSLISSLSTSWTQVCKSRYSLFMRANRTASNSGCRFMRKWLLCDSSRISKTFARDPWGTEIYDQCISQSKEWEICYSTLLDRLISSRILSQLSAKVKFWALFTSWYNFFKWAQISDAFLKECRANPLLGSTEFRCQVTTIELYWFHVTRAFYSVGAGMLLSK